MRARGKNMLQSVVSGQCHWDGDNPERRDHIYLYDTHAHLCTNGMHIYLYVWVECNGKCNICKSWDYVHCLAGRHENLRFLICWSIITINPKWLMLTLSWYFFSRGRNGALYWRCCDEYHRNNWSPNQSLNAWMCHRTLVLSGVPRRVEDQSATLMKGPVQFAASARWAIRVMERS